MEKGKDHISNLPPDLRAYVRTPEFKAFFGDWENDPEHSSKVVDENGEPLLVWHGSARSFDRFDLSRGGETSGGGVWTDRRTGEQVDDDSTRAAFFSSLRDQAVSYSMLAQHKDNIRLESASSDLCMLFKRAGEDLRDSMFLVDIKTREDCMEAMRLLEDRIPALHDVIGEAEAHPERKIVSDIIAGMEPDRRTAIADALEETRTMYRRRLREMDHGQLSNVMHNLHMQEKEVESLKENMDRLRRNDMTVPNEFGTFENYSASLFGGTGNAEADIYFDDDDRCVFRSGSGEGTRFVHLDEASDEEIAGIVKTMDTLVEEARKMYDKEVEDYGFDENANIYGCFVNLRNPLVHDYEGSPMLNNYKDTKYTAAYVASRQVRKALADGNDGVVYKDIADPFKSDSYGIFDASQVMIVRHEKSVKEEAHEEPELQEAGIFENGPENAVKKQGNDKSYMSLHYVLKEISIVKHQGPWTRKEAEDNLSAIYLFTDNTDRDSGRGVINKDSRYFEKFGGNAKELHYPTTTAAVVRGLDNAFPVSTQRWYHEGAKGETGRWQDADAELFRQTVMAEFADIRREILARVGDIDTVFIPDGDGFFNGRISKITQERTPVLYEILRNEVDKLENFVTFLNEDIKIAAANPAPPLPKEFTMPEFDEESAIESIVKDYVFDGKVAYADEEANLFPFGAFFPRYIGDIRLAAEMGDLKGAHSSKVADRYMTTEAVYRELAYLMMTGFNRGGFRSRQDIVAALGLASLRVPSVRPVFDAARLNPDKDIHREIVLAIPEDRRRAIGLELTEAAKALGQERNTDIVREIGTEEREMKPDVAMDTTEAEAAGPEAPAQAETPPEDRKFNKKENDMPNNETKQIPMDWFGGLPLPDKIKAYSFIYDGTAKNPVFPDADVQRVKDLVNLVKEDATVTEGEGNQYLTNLFLDLTQEQQRLMMDMAVADKAVEEGAGQDAGADWVHSLPLANLVELLTRFNFPDEGVSEAFDRAFDAVSGAVAPGWDRDLDDDAKRRKLLDVFDSFAPEVKDAFYADGPKMDLAAQGTAGQETGEQLVDYSKVSQSEAVAWVHSLPAFSLAALLHDFRYPEAGLSEEFDRAHDAVQEAMGENWSRGLDDVEIKRKLHDVFDSFAPEVKAAFYVEGSKMDLAMHADDIQQFQVYTLGISTHSRDDFMKLVPKDVTMVVDVRRYPFNNYRKEFNKPALEEAFRGQGARYVHLKDLSGKTSNEAYLVEGKQKKGVADYAAIANSDDFKKAYRTLRGAVERGETVLVISSEGDPGRSQRALLIGQELAKDDILVGHISSSRNGSRMLFSQDAVVRSLLNRNNSRNRIVSGSSKDISFESDGTWHAGKNVVIMKAEEDVTNRVIRGNWNYGNKVEIVEGESGGVIETHRQLAKWADYSVFLALDGLAGEEHGIVHSFGHEGFSVSVKGDPDDLRDPAYAEKIADRISAKLARNLLYHFDKDPDSVNLENVKLQIAGSDIARITTKPVNEKVSEDELYGINSETKKKTGGAQAGYKLDDQRGISQEDVNIFMSNVIRHLAVNANSIKGEDMAGEYELPYKITEIGTTGNTGFEEAATLASQEFGVSSHILAPKGYRLVLDNETLQGRVVRDMAVFVNRFKLGVKNVISPVEMQTQLNHIMEESKEREISLTPGLTDRQILILSRLGFTNSQINTMIEVAENNNVVVSYTTMNDEDGTPRSTCAADLLTFIEDCGGYGVEGGESFSALTVMKAEADVDRIVEEDRERGIGYVTVNSPSYPERLRQFKGFIREFQQQEWTYDKESRAAAINNVNVEVKEERPAILRFTGDTSILSTPSVAVVGNYSSSEEAQRAGRLVGRALRDGGITLVTSLYPAHVIAHNTSSVGFISEVYRDDESAAVLNKTYARKDSQSAALNENVQDGGSAIAITPRSLDRKEDRDQIARIVEKGGLVLSEMMPWHRENDANAEGIRTERASMLMTAVGGTAVVVDSISKKNRTAAYNIAASAPDGHFVVSYPGNKGVYDMIAGNEEAEADGFSVIATSGAGLDELVRSVSGQSVDTEAEDLREVAEFLKNEDLHPDRYQFYVVRRGLEWVFIVPERYPDVREAVKKQYGDDVKFSNDRNQTIRELENITEEFGGSTFTVSGEYLGTQIQNDPVYSVPLYYHEGQVYSQMTAPDDTPGLAPMRVRLEQRQLFELFKEKAAVIQEKLQAAAGFPKSRPIHFENALYPVIKPNAVDIYEGDALRGRVSISPFGRIKVENFDRLSSSLQEHVQRRDPFFMAPGGRIDKVSVDMMATLMEMRLLGTSINESDMYALADRETLEDIREKIEQGWETPSKDNVDVASTDINHGEKAGLLARPEGEKANREEIVEALLSEVSKEYKSLRTKEANAKKMETQIDELRKERDSVFRDGSSSEAYKELDRKIVEASDDLVALQEKIRSLQEAIATKKALITTVCTAPEVYVVPGDEKGSVYSVGGQAIHVKPGKISAEISKKATQMVASIPTAATVKAEKLNALIAKVEERPVEAEAIARKYDSATKARQANDLNASKEEVVKGSLSNGFCIVNRDGKQAYATEDLKIVSKFYDKLGLFGKKHGMATRADGKFNFIDATGTEIIPVWIDSIGTQSEGFSVIVKDGLYNHVGANGRILSEDWCGNCHDFHEGWAVIQAGPDDPEGIRGKYNYVNYDGNVMFTIDKWLDDAGDFVKGTATVKRDGKVFQIDRYGKEQRMLPPEGGAGGGSNKRGV